MAVHPGLKKGLRSSVGCVLALHQGLNKCVRQTQSRIKTHSHFHILSRLIEAIVKIETHFTMLLSFIHSLGGTQ